MKTTRSRVLNAVSFAAVLLGLLLAATPSAFATAENHVDEGLAVSKTWVGLIDNGRYDDSYASACGAMHDKIPQDRWNIILKTLRQPWGPVVNRQQLSHVYKPNGFEGSEGEFLVITYDSTFQKQDGITEVVVLRWEDGQWRGAGYNAGPKANPDNTAENSDPAGTTETETHEHVKPDPQ
jgi:hypothetical protein